MPHKLAADLRDDAADPGYHMKYQAELGDVDFITGDYLAGIYNVTFHLSHS
jgi:hypothetical protein